MRNLGSYQTMTTMAKESGGPMMLGFMLLSCGFIIGCAFTIYTRNNREVIVINTKEQSA